MRGHDSYGILRVDVDEGRFCRHRLWARALDSGCDAKTLAGAYNVDPKTVTRGAMEYRRRVANGKS